MVSSESIHPSITRRPLIYWSRRAKERETNNNDTKQGSVFFLIMGKSLLFSLFQISAIQQPHSLTIFHSFGQLPLVPHRRPSDRADRQGYRGAEYVASLGECGVV
jgi:hypothetical protein